MEWQIGLEEIAFLVTFVVWRFFIAAVKQLCTYFLLTMSVKKTFAKKIYCKCMWGCHCGILVGWDHFRLEFLEDWSILEIATYINCQIFGKTDAQWAWLKRNGSTLKNFLAFAIYSLCFIEYVYHFSLSTRICEKFQILPIVLSTDESAKLKFVEYIHKWHHNLKGWGFLYLFFNKMSDFQPHSEKKYTYL